MYSFPVIEEEECYNDIRDEAMSIIIITNYKSK